MSDEAKKPKIELKMKTYWDRHDLMKKYPPTVALTPAQPGYVLPVVFWDEESMTFDHSLYPVVAWITRSNIHPDLRGSHGASQFAALVLTPDYGLLASDDSWIDDAENETAMGIVALADFDPMKSLSTVQICTKKADWKLYKKAGD